jgi:hypothetical protein
LGGSEVNTDPQQGFHRFIINFGQMNLEQASSWPDLLTIVRDRVKPERDRLKNNSDGRRRKRDWWQYGRWTPALFDALSSLSRCLVIPQQFPNHVRVAFQPTDRILSQKLVVLPLDGFSHFAVLQSNIHDCWTQTYCGAMGVANTPVYSPSACFETFPFPRSDPRTPLPKLEKIGEQLYEARAKYMVDTQQGLTKTYNALKDPSCTDRRILALREQHEAMDVAVLAEYGWDNVKVPAFCAKTANDTRAQETFKSKVIDLLYELNAQRAKEEELQGLARSKAKSKAKEKSKAQLALPEATSGKAENDNSEVPPKKQSKTASKRPIAGPKSVRPSSRPAKTASGGRK